MGTRNTDKRSPDRLVSKSNIVISIIIHMSKVQKMS